MVHSTDRIRCVLAVSDRVVSLCVRDTSEQAKGKVVLPSMHGRTQEEASVIM